MMKHQKNTRTKYEFAFISPTGETVYRFWLVSKSVTKAQRMACQYVNDIEKFTGTNWENWNFTPFGLENKISGHVAKFTGETLYGLRG